jgi:hypothetical protein
MSSSVIRTQEHVDTASFDHTSLQDLGAGVSGGGIWLDDILTPWILHARALRTRETHERVNRRVVERLPWDFFIGNSKITLLNGQLYTSRAIRWTCPDACPQD